MYCRRDLIEIFSTFMRLEEEGCRSWIADPRLRRSMEQCIEQVSDAPSSESFWALYWHQHWRSGPNRLAEAHLSAYLQETCYWAAKKTLSFCPSSRYQLTDCFQIAIAAVPKVLRGFDAKRASRLKDYAYIAFRSTLRDTLRASQEADICTDWALLRKLSQKRLEEALSRTGLNSQSIARYHLAWMCFKALYAPTQVTGSRRLPKPDSALWEAVAASYNRDRFRFLNSPGQEQSPQNLELWLVECAKSARNYLYPSSKSLNSPKSESDGRERIEEIAIEFNPALIEQLIEQERDEERQQQHQQLNGFLEAAIRALKPQNQELIELYYRSQLTQQQIAARLDLKQYQVSRQLARGRESLLKALVQWSQETRNIPLTSQMLQETSEVLEEWLWGYYRDC
ncbi:MAG: sigma-70 family RNA polymerase sigma factor [Cyanobacteriota bacterium]|nr:sigma-70 family RNA polymerase sigma factor [Cyanobacteriota bacterium]